VGQVWRRYGFNQLGLTVGLPQAPPMTPCFAEMNARFFIVQMSQATKVGRHDPMFASLTPCHVQL
jgi:hypothetical protein